MKLWIENLLSRLQIIWSALTKKHIVNLSFNYNFSELIVLTATKSKYVEELSEMFIEDIRSTIKSKAKLVEEDGKRAKPTRNP